ncbi:hypothetical protein PQR46_33110 [Paraburkholderia sediminicola]|uniref:hypothetical protein n=1 Tax=Paraburkholderia TaxID=1822464 RepID=UPI0038B75446
MSQRDIKRAMTEIGAYESGERQSNQLTWRALARVVRFSDKTLRSKPELRKRFEQARRTLSSTGRARRSTGMVHDDLQDTIAELRAELSRYEELENDWLERWIRIAASLRSHGMSIEQFDVDLVLRNEQP